jgi:hypothetical protein
MNNNIYEKCLVQADKLMKFDSSIELDIFQIADYIYKEEINKKEREEYTDQKLINFNDEIIEIEELDERELIDISVSGDNLFYANDILTKNSFGLPATLDWFIAVTQDEVLKDNGQQCVHLLKTRWGNKSHAKPELVNIDWDKMRYSDVGGEPEQTAKKVGKRKPGDGKKKLEKKVTDIEWD